MTYFAYAEATRQSNKNDGEDKKEKKIESSCWNLADPKKLRTGVGQGRQVGHDAHRVQFSK